MPDQTDQPPTKRMTTAEVAALAQAVDGRVDDLAAVVTDVATRLQDLGTLSERAANGGASGWLTRDQLTQHVHEALAPLHDELHEIRQRTPLTSATMDLTDYPTRDQVDGRIHEALRPLHDEVHDLRRKGTLTPDSQKSLSNVLARLEDAERKAAGVDVNGLTTAVSQQLHPTLSDLRTRLAAVEQAAKAMEADPVSHTLAEDALADQIEHQVDRKVQEMFAGTGVAPAEIASTAVAIDNLKKRVGWLTDQLANEVGARMQRTEVELASVAGMLSAPGPSAINAAHVMVAGQRSTGGLGAARKVLQLMRAVTHIGKDRQADMGQGGKFRFRGIDEAMDAVGHAMRDVGLILSPEVLKDETSTTPVTKKGDGRNGPYESTILWTTTKLTMRYTFVDPEDGSTHPLEMVGEGRDASDKSTSKAGSMAFKYGLLQALCIPVNGLDDSDAAPPQVMENEQSTRPLPQQYDRTDAQKATRAGEALGAIRNVYRVQGGAQAQYNRLVQIMNQVKAEGLLDFTVEGSTLNGHGEAAMATLQAPPPAQEQQPDAADDPWGN